MGLVSTLVGLGFEANSQVHRYRKDIMRMIIMEGKGGLDEM
jgi:hypothetical protein